MERNYETVEVVLITPDGERKTLEDMLFEYGVDGTLERLGMDSSPNMRGILERYLDLSIRIGRNELHMLSAERDLEEGLKGMSYEEVLAQIEDLDEETGQDILDIYLRVNQQKTEEEDENEQEDKDVFPILQ